MIFVLLLAACAGAAHPNVSLPANLIPIPLYRQRTDFSCGPSSALSLLRYYLWEEYQHTPEQALYKGMNCSRENGTDPAPIANYFTNVAGLRATYISNQDPAATMSQIKANINEGLPTLIDLQAYRDNPFANWTKDWDDGHYNVLVGYDATNLFFMDPSTDGTYAYIEESVFLQRWHDVEGDDDHHTFTMAIFVEPSSTTHPETPSKPYATYEP